MIRVMNQDEAKPAAGQSFSLGKDHRGVHPRARGRFGEGQPRGPASRATCSRTPGGTLPPSDQLLIRRRGTVEWERSPPLRNEPSRHRNAFRGHLVREDSVTNPARRAHGAVTRREEPRRHLPGGHATNIPATPAKTRVRPTRPWRLLRPITPSQPG